MVKKKDTLIDEAKKIKAELDELKRRKKAIKKTFRKKITKPVKKPKAITSNRKSFVINSMMFKFVKNNVASFIAENATSSSDSQIINCMILHAFRNGFGVKNIKTILKNFEKNHSKNSTLRKTIVLNYLVNKKISITLGQSLIDNNINISNSKILNLLIYHALENDFKSSLVKEYLKILKSSYQTEKVLHQGSPPAKKPKKEETVKCKICKIEFPRPTENEKKYHMCSICGKKAHPTKTQVKIGVDVQIIHIDFQNKKNEIFGKVQQILTPGDWHYEGLMVYLDNGYQGRVKKVITNENSEEKPEINSNYARLVHYDPEESVKNTENNELKEFEEKQEKLRKRNIQINLEINELKLKEKNIQDEINLEKNQQKKRQGKGISKLFNRFSSKNKPLEEYSYKFFQEKNQQLEKIRLEIRDLLVEQRKADMNIRLAGEEISKIKESDIEIKKLEDKIHESYILEKESSIEKEEEEEEEEEDEEN